MVHNALTIQTKKPTDGVDIFFVGDEQEGSPGYRKDVWAEFVADWKRSPNPYMIHMGDARDWLRPTMRTKVKAAMTGDRSAHAQLDDFIMLGLNETLERLDPFRGRVIGMHQGHHDWEFLSGATCTMLLAQHLKALNYGWKAGTRLGLKFASSGRNSKGGAYYFTIATSHGNASGRDTTGVAGSMERSMKDIICDLKVQGHACRSAAWTPHEYTIIKKRDAPGIVRVVPRHLLVGGFCEAYTNGWISVPKCDMKTKKEYGGNPLTTYAEERGLTPQPPMWGVARLRLRYSKELNKERNMAPGKTPLLDIETVNRGPGVQAGQINW